MKKVRGDFINVYVGRRIQLRRRSLCYTLDEISVQTGISRQMISKYEHGAIQIPPCALLALTLALSVDVNLLFPQNPELLSVKFRENHNEILGVSKYLKLPSLEDDAYLCKETVDLIEAFYQLPSAELRKAIRNLVRTVALEMHQANALLGPQ